MNILDELRSIIEVFEIAQIPFALCGGMAMAVYDVPRATLDIDVLVEETHLDRAKDAARRIGFSVDAGEMSFQEGQIRIHRMTKPGIDPDNALILDFLIVTELLLDVWMTRKELTWDYGIIPVVSPQGLIRLKELRGSGQDRDDIGRLRNLIDET